LTFTDCYQCHQSDFTGATNPNHVTGGYSHDCTSCHSQSSWDGASFNHSTTRFPLVGAHANKQCVTCHTGGNYQLSFTDCYQCHQSDFTGASNPNHVANGYSHDCTQCHSQTTWDGATFDHATTRFPLTGAHTTSTCVSCHTGGNYQLTFTDCYACHQSDFALPTNPNHIASAFGHDCTPCHTTSVWKPSTFNHDQQYFKINSGRHRQEWTLCSDCHQSAGNYTQFTCISCHEHNQTSTDRDHQGVRNYLYSSPSCYSCHRNV
jgi:nitrate/TMAO reductase-like tetraheme cytochrome c subunit